MGVLAGAATYEQNGKTPGLAAVNVCEPLLRLLKNVGLTELIFVEPEPFETPALEFVRLEEQRGEKERLACVRAAHEHLMKINERNEEIFRPFVAALELEMKQRGMKGPRVERLRSADCGVRSERLQPFAVRIRNPHSTLRTPHSSVLFFPPRFSSRTIS